MVDVLPTELIVHSTEWLEMRSDLKCLFYWKISLSVPVRFFSVVERPYRWLVTINYITLSLSVGKRMKICSTFESKGNDYIESVLMSSHLLLNFKY